LHACGFGSFWFRNLERHHQPVAAAVNRLDVLGMFGIVLAERLANSLDTLHDGLVGGRTAAPNLFDQHILADHAGLMPCQRNQRIHLFGLEMYVGAVAAHDASFRNDGKRSEFETAPQIRVCCHASKPFVIFPAICRNYSMTKQ